MQQQQQALKVGLEQRLKLVLVASKFKSFEPSQYVDQIIQAVPELLDHRLEIYTIINELYNNALEHGILCLDSGLKATSDGITDYYKIRQDRINNIHEGQITIDFFYQPANKLTITITDSGSGFTAARYLTQYNLNQQSAPDRFFGRGIQIVKALTTLLEYNQKGNEVTAIINLKN